MLTECDGACDRDIHRKRTGPCPRDQRWLPSGVAWKLSLEGWVGATKTGKGEESYFLGRGDRLFEDLEVRGLVENHSRA